MDSLTVYEMFLFLLYSTARAQKRRGGGGGGWGARGWCHCFGEIFV